jgi:hypothetical protein
MKKLITILAALVICANIVVQAQDWLWAKSIWGTSSTTVLENEGTIKSCTDANGNVYVTGRFLNETLTLDTITLTSNVGSFFIVKYDSDGNVLWANSANTEYYYEVHSICADAIGNVYVIGNFNAPTITFGAITLTNTNSGNSQEVFLVKYSSDGIVLWARSAGGSTGEEGKDVTTDGNNNVYIVGTFTSTITIGSTTLTSAGSMDVFLVKYDPNGTILWAKSEGSQYSEYGHCVTTDASGNVYIAGLFASSTITIGTTTLTNSVSYEYFTSDIFIAKYTPDGEVLWAKSAGGTRYDNIYEISSDNSGNLFIGGDFWSTTFTIGTTTITNAVNDIMYPSIDVYIAKYTSDGTLQWVNTIAGINNDFIGDICTDTYGNVYATGCLPNSNITTGTTSTINLILTGTPAAYIVKYAPDGSALWANILNESLSGGGSINTDASGNLYSLGSFRSPTINIEATTLYNTDNSSNTGDYYIAKFGGTITSTNEPFANNQLIIFPNPTNSIITLTMPSQKNSSVSITTLTGTEVGTYTTQNTSTQTIDISHLASGVYFVSLKSEEGVVTKKIIKQ